MSKAMSKDFLKRSQKKQIVYWDQWRFINVKPQEKKCWDLHNSL